MRRVAALVPNCPGVLPGQRVRIETWAEHLEHHGWAVDLYPFGDERLQEVLYEPGHARAKASRLVSCYWRQLHRLRRLPPPDLLFIYQEAALVGPALLERLAQRRGTPMVYDLDDPRFLPYRSPSNGWASLLKFPGKTRSLLRLADQVIVINTLLQTYAARFNPSVTVIPNVVDLDRYQQVTPPPGPARLVWIGSQSTMKNLQTIAPALARLQADCNTPVRVVAAAPSVIPGVRTDFRPWSAASEVADLQDCHVGLLPIADTPWNRMKFFFKAVQYMALGLPIVAQRMGSNIEIIEDGVNGFLVESQEEWYHKLRMLVENPDLRHHMGAAARATAVKRFSLPVQIARVADTFDRAAARRWTP